jgi:hypothetical protein
MVREQSFSGDKDESPSSHLREFEQLCSCLLIAGMSQDTLKWKLFVLVHHPNRLFGAVANFVIT